MTDVRNDDRPVATAEAAIVTRSLREIVVGDKVEMRKESVAASP